VTGVGGVAPERISGAVLFGRYAYPPNELGYCGPDEHAQLLEQVAARVDDGDLRRLVRGFDGAWPYLELIAGAAGIGDPLDRRVVEAYWVGNELLDRVGSAAMGRSMQDRFSDRLTRRSFERLADTVPAGAVPHHSFHVFGVYPWLGLLRGGRVDEPLRVLDRCRIRWGQVSGSTDDGLARVRSRPLQWDGRRLYLGVPREESAVVALDGLGLSEPLRPGEWCALHWDWVCDRLNRRQLLALRRHTARQLDVVNAQRFPAPAAVLA
jgi:hypothetical protein